MSHEEQIEWPSFETVLRDVAPDSPTARSLASAGRRPQYSAAARATDSSALLGVEHDVRENEIEIVEAATPARNTATVATASLPEPLAPLDLDTSSIRALLEPRPTSEVESPMAEEALRELDPLPELEVFADVASFDDATEIEVLDEVEVEPTVATDTSDLVDTPVLDTTDVEQADTELEEIEPAGLADQGDTLEFAAFEPLSLHDVEPAPDERDLFEPVEDDSLVFELDADEIDQVDAAHELDTVDSAEPLANPFSEDSYATNDQADIDHDTSDDEVLDTPLDNLDYSSLVVDVDDLQIDDLNAPDAPELPQSVTSVPGIELPGDSSAPIEIFDDLAPMNMQGLEDTPSFEPESDTFDSPGLDLFDLNDDSNAIEQERIALHGEGLYEQDTGFDSIAAADEIETDLDQLIGLGDEAEPDNVIPLRPEIDIAETATSSESSPMDLDGLSLASGTDWVALAPEPASQASDPWADMRPTEEPKKTGFWANRPKFFGGDERRRRKAERRETEGEALDQAVDVTFDKECPRCGSECQVDLDDPIGRRVHVSCPSCQNIWYTPYILEDSQAG